MHSQTDAKQLTYCEEKARDQLKSRGISLPEQPTPLEKRLMAELLLLSGAALRVLSDVDDDGLAEAHDIAVLGMREALVGKRLPMYMPAAT